MNKHTSSIRDIPFWSNIFRRQKDEKYDLMIVLSGIPMFSDLNKSELKKLCKIIYERNYKENEYFFEEKNPGSAMFIIKEGSVSIEHIREDGEKTILATVHEGDFIGEIALLNDADRTASARCLTNTKVLVLFRQDLMDLIESEVSMGKKIFKSLAMMTAERLVKTNKMLIDHKKLLEETNETN